MKEIKNIFRLILCLILSIVVNSMGIMADENNSLEIKFLNGSVPMSGIEAQIVKVGEYDDTIEINQENADKYYNYVKDNSHESIKKTSNNNGIAVFENIEKGYYVVFVDKNEKYSIKPAIVKVNGSTKIKAKVEETGGGESTTNISVRKLWYDNDNSANTRPNTVEITLLLDGNEYKKAELNKDNDFKFTFNNLPKNRKFTVKETAVNGYEAEYHYEDNNITIINKLKEDKNNGNGGGNTGKKEPSGGKGVVINGKEPDNNENQENNTDNDNNNDSTDNNQNAASPIDISVEKQWIGDGERSNIKVYLIKEESILGACVISSETDWQGKFENMPYYNSYEIWEEEIDGWKPVYEGNQKDGFVIKNYSDDEYEAIKEKTPTIPEVPQPDNDDIVTVTEKSNEKIPQTGMLMWPIPLLMGGGLLLIVVGIYLIRGKNSDK